MLFQADVLGVPVMEIVAAEAKRAASEPDRVASWLYAREIVDGVTDHRDEIDDLIASYAQGWTHRQDADTSTARCSGSRPGRFSATPRFPRPSRSTRPSDSRRTTRRTIPSRFVNGVLGKIADHAKA